MTIATQRPTREEKNAWHFGIFGCEIAKVEIYAITYMASHIQFECRKVRYTTRPWCNSWVKLFDIRDVSIHYHREYLAIHRLWPVNLNPLLKNDMKRFLKQCRRNTHDRLCCRRRTVIIIKSYDVCLDAWIYSDKNSIYVWIKDEKIYINNVFMGGFRSDIVFQHLVLLQAHFRQTVHHTVTIKLIAL